jgi:hypothetical protein
MLTPGRQRRPEEAQMIRIDPIPVELGRKERRFRERIGDRGGPDRIGEFREPREFLEPPLADNVR